MKTLLTHRLSQSEIMQLCASTHGVRNNHLKEELYQLTLDEDRPTCGCQCALDVYPFRSGRQ